VKIGRHDEDDSNVRVEEMGVEKIIEASQLRPTTFEPNEEARLDPC